MNKFIIFLIVGLYAFAIDVQAQKVFMNGDVYSTDPINPEAFNENLFQEVMLYKVNYYMDSLGLEGFEAHDFFIDPATQHALYMAETQDASLDGKGAFKTVRTRLIAAGGSGVGAELVARITIRVSNEFITYESLADQVLDRWKTGKFANDLFSQKYFFAGISAKIDETGKKIFVSMYIGNYASLGSNYYADGGILVPVTTKKYGLKPSNEKLCKKATGKMPDLVDLQSGLSINDNGEIVFKYNDLKRFKRFIKGKKDALAVDVIQKEQYNNCNGENVADFSRPNIGFMTKRIWSKKLYKNNLAEAEGAGKKTKVTKLEVILGELPLELRPEDVELNLMIIKNKSVCANIPQSYVDKKIYDFVPKIGLLPDTVLPAGVPEYLPTETSAQLNFRIPFEQGKYTYNPEDMVPVIAALNEPDFIIDKIFISAFSSLEGTNNENTILQKKRAESIVKALEENQNASIIDSIVTAPNLKDLQADAKGTIYDEVCTMNLEEAIAYVNAHRKEMEFLLENHRYADVTMWITYDIAGEKEQRYVIDQFNKAVEANKLDYALSIQKYIMKQVINGHYSDKAVSDMRIPQGKEYVGLNMNKIWLTQYVFMDVLDEDYLTKIDDLNKLDNNNIYVEFNDILCEIVVTDLNDSKSTDILQTRIDGIYNTPIKTDLVDLLNIELQYQIMDIVKDSLGFDHPTVVKSMNKIKEIIKFNELTWENSLKLASVFINHADYEYAIRLLEPYIFDEHVPFVFLTTYVTVCSKVENKVHSNSFYYALERIKQQDKNFFCGLFSPDKLSLQTFVNTKVKNLYCETCNK
ncbi:MAG TPA: hypothetical protein PLL66_08250 [Bacteroidales bacterium]|nr:hypothetical protein [Bacteroidales bacterium]